MVLIMAMLFIAIFASLSIAMMTMSSTNVQLANNHHQGNRALVNTQSGVEVVRYLLDGMTIPASIETGMQNQLTIKGLTNITATVSGNEIILSDVSLDSASSDSFSARITTLSGQWQVDVTGTNGQINRTVRTIFNMTEQADSVFDFGVATKGALLMTGQSEISGVNLSDVYIDTSIVGDSFTIGDKGSVAGNVHIVNPSATYKIGKHSEIGGETGAAAEDNIILGANPIEFPVPDTDYFRQFVNPYNIINAHNLNDYINGNVTLDNFTIAGGTDPNFAGTMTIRGVLFIEQPNRVKFAGQLIVQGIIVGDSAVGDDSYDNDIDFSGQVQCLDMAGLTGAEFEAVKQETRTFLIAPGFSADFSGQSNFINGVIAVAGVRFTGQAGGTIDGSIINYSSEPMVMEGQGSLQFNKTGIDDNPAGFTPVMTLHYTPSSYSEI